MSTGGMPGKPGRNYPQMDRLESGKNELSSEAVRQHETITIMAEDKRIERLREIETIYKGARERAAIEQHALLALCDALESSGSKALETARGIRMSLNSEMAQILAALKDVRIFLGDEKHDEEVRRLREFSDLADRLKVLKESGFLDNIVETLLRFSGSKQ
jgi:hypothetical protein